MKYTIEQLHIAAQYLSAIGINYINKQADDSHTNLGWDKEKMRLTTHTFGDQNYQLGLSFKTGQVEWIENGVSTYYLDLTVSTHGSNLEWIGQLAEKHGLGVYSYTFHYDLPYKKINEDHIFSFDRKDVDEISKRINQAHVVFENTLSKHNLKSPIRVWSHHFDLGIYTQLDNIGNLFMGAGLAIPDALEDDMYYYASGWKNGESVSTGEFSGLKNGRWRKDWNGAILTSTGIDNETAETFYDEAISELMKNT